MKYDLTQKMYDTKVPMIRRIGEMAKQNLKPEDRFISFSGGMPAPAALPVEMVQKYSKEVLEEEGVPILQYGPHSGYEPLKAEIRKFINKKELIAKDDDEILITYGSSEGLYLMANAFINPGDTVIVEDPTYLNALNVFDMHGAKIIGVPVEDDGVDIVALEEVMKKGAKFFYTIPTFGNPTGITMSREKRKAVYELAPKYQIPVLEDNPYGYLRFSGEGIETIKSYDTQGAVVYAGTMSKIISPGMRLGFLCMNKELYQKMLALKGNGTGANVNWSQYTIAKILQNVDIDVHIERVARLYAEKAKLMLDKMEECFHPLVKFTKPEGGMFIWVTLPTGIKSLPFCEEAAKELHISIVPGSGFCVNNPDECTSMRFNFTLSSEEEIIYGIEKIGELTYKYCK